jgi:hypothetical protein
VGSEDGFRVQEHGAESSSRSASDSKGENRRLDRKPKLNVGIGGRISLIWTYEADSAVHLIASTVELVMSAKLTGGGLSRLSLRCPILGGSVISFASIVSRRDRALMFLAC